MNGVILIGNRVKLLRHDKGLSLNSLAKQLGISAGGLSEIENNKYSPGAKLIVQLSEFLSVSADWLLTGSDSDLAPPAINNVPAREADQISKLNKQIKSLQKEVEDLKKQRDKLYQDLITTKDQLIKALS